MTSADNKGLVLVAAASAVVASVATAAALSYYQKKQQAAALLDTKSRQIYETQDSARQYMEFHFTPSSVSYCRNLKSISEAFDFPIRVAKKFDKFRAKTCGRALDLGCATGASVFEMSKVFDEVVGVDLSNAFISYANELKDNGTIEYCAPEQGKVTIPRTASIPAGTHPERCTFVVGDALNVDPKLGKFDGVLAANLLDRVPEPRKLMDSYQGLVNPGGILVMVTPYSWWEGACPVESWIGGRPGEPRSEDQTREILSQHFELLEDGDEPFLIRDHCRRFQLGFSHCTVWRRK